MSSYKVNFRCLKPGCNGEHVQEHLIEVTQDSEIKGFLAVDAGHDIDYGDAESDGGEVQCYTCMTCGYELTDDMGRTVDDNESMMEWLGDHEMLEPIQ